MASIINTYITNNNIGLKLSGKGRADNYAADNNYDYNGLGISLWSNANSNREIVLLDSLNINNDDYTNLRFGIVSNTSKITGNTSIQFNNYLTTLNNKIGLGTTNPYTSLHVKSNIILTGTIVDPNNNLITNNVWTNIGNKLFYNKGFIGIGLTNPSSLLELANSSIILSSSYKIGIGKTNPLSALDVFNNDVKIEDGALFCSLVNSKIGVGNTNPQSSLDVKGDISLSGTLLNLDGTPYVFKTLNPEQWSNSSFNYNNIYYNSGYVGIGLVNQSSSLYINGNIRIDGNIINGSGSVFNGSPWNDITINTSNYIYYNNNIGIGTNEPIDLLHLTLINSNLNIRLTDATTNHTSNDGFIIGLDSNQNGFLWNYENASLIFGTSNKEQLRITNNGNIGIGTTNPRSLLHLVSSNNSNAFINIDNGLIIGKDSNQCGLLWNSNNTDLIFGTNNEEKLRIKSSNSNIGIGTNNPNSLLHLYKSGINLLSFNDQGTTAVQIGKTNDSNAIFWNSNNTALTFKTNNIERMRIANNGNIGIGTNNPQSLLHLVSSNNSNAFINIDNGLIIGKDSNQCGLLWNSNNTDLIFVTNNEEKLRIKSSNNNNNNNIKLDNNNEIVNLFNNKKPWAIYFAENYDAINNIIVDSSGNNNTATTTGTITKSTASGNGALAPITYISGGTTTTVTFPAGSIPTTFTILSLTRYSGSTYGRIINSSTGNWLHGHWGYSEAMRGVCYYNTWVTPLTSTGTVTDWLCCIGKNSGSTPGNVLIDGVGRGSATGGTGGSGYQMSINTTEESDWALSCVMIWDQALTDEEMVNLNTMINNYKTVGFSLKNYILNLNASSITNGITINNSQALLQLYKSGVITQNVLLSFNDQGTTAIQIGKTIDNNAIFWNSNNTTLTLKTNNIERMRIANNGNIGIGNNNPLSLLHLSATTANTAININIDNGLIIGKDSSQNGVILNNNDTSIIFGNNNTEKMRINANIKLQNHNELNTLFNSKKPWAMYFAEDYDNNTTLLDCSGNNRNASTSSGITKSLSSGNGASASINYISGGTNANISFASGSIPSTFTILSLTRYTGGTRGRILEADNINWIHGHFGGNRGVCYYGNSYVWITTYTNVGTTDEWLCCIGKNSGDYPNNILLDGTASGVKNGGTGNSTLKLNSGYSSERSDWAFSCVMIWDTALGDNEMVLLNNLINTYKSTGISIRNYILSLFNTSGSSYNIGIGVNNPQSLLHLYKSGGNLLSFNDQGTIAVQFGKTNDNNAIFWNSNNTALTFKTNNIERMRISNNGNIGIGVANPQYLLDVNNNINIEGGLSIGSSSAFINNTNVDNDNTSNTYLILKQAGSTNDWCYVRQLGGIDNYKLSFDFYDNTDSRFAIRYIVPSISADTVKEVFKVDQTYTFANGLGLNGENTTDTIFQTTSNLGITVNNENNNYISFNVGLTNEVMRITNDTININNNSKLYNIPYNPNTNLTPSIYGIATDAIILYQGTASIYPYSIGYNYGALVGNQYKLYFSIPNNASHKFYINGNEALNINSSSFIVYNNIEIVNPSNPGLVFTSFGGTAIGVGNYSSSATSGDMVIRSKAGNKLILQTGANEGHLIINNGRIGIGTDNPSTILDVRKDNIRLSGNIYKSDGTLYSIDKGTLASVSSSNLILRTNIETTLTPTFTDTNNKYYLFEKDGSITFNKAISVDILLVGAGGNGGLGTFSGGGGAGEVIYYPNYTFTPGTYNLTVGNNDYKFDNTINYIKQEIYYSKNNVLNPTIYNLFVTKKPWACYFAEDYYGSTLYDSSGNNRHATTSGGTITKTTASGNGATAPITYISGGTTSIVSFPTGSIPSTFTILSLTRYTGGTRARILQADGIDWVHGHYSSSRGVCYYNSWITQQSSIGTIDDWLCCIGKNSGTTPRNILIDGIGRGNTTGGTGNGNLRINAGNISWESSDWALSCVMIWDQALTDQEMIDLNLIINNYKITGFYYSTNRNSIIKLGSREIITATGGGDGGSSGLFVSIKPWAMYFAEDYDYNNNILLDSSGNNRHATTSGGTITKTTASGNGATAPITYISGGTTSIVSFPTGSIPTTFTILSLTRYTGSIKKRILQADGIDWVHGHYSSSRGVCYYNSWITQQSSIGTIDDWLCCIGKNSGTTPRNILIDGIGRGNTTGGTGNGNLRINAGSISWESSDWALSCVMIWDQALTDQEMIDLNMIINNYLSTGLSIKNNFITKLPLNGGCGGGGYNSNSIIVSGATSGLKWNTNYSYINDGQSGSLLKGGDGGSALINNSYIEQITQQNFKVGKGGFGISNITYRLFTTKKNYGDGGDGGGGIGAKGIIIIKPNVTNSLIATDVNTKTLTINNINNSFLNYKDIYPYCSCNVNYLDNSNSGYYLMTSTTIVTFKKDTLVDLLLVGAGGNAGNGTNSGGGGSGEVIYLQNYLFSYGTYNIQIGNNILNDGNTFINDFSNIIAKKGGYGLDNIDNIPSISKGSINSIPNVLYEKYLLFNENSTFSFNKDVIVSVVLIGGGGGGGGGGHGRISAGGGGGAGEYKYINNIYIQANTTINVIIGSGGIGNYRTTNYNNNGSNTLLSSSYFLYSTRGGGGGANEVTLNGFDGASGGGGGSYNGIGGKSYSFDITGFDGGNGLTGGYIYAAGGGGGFLSNGKDAYNNGVGLTGGGGDGGFGTETSITGSLLQVCGGGGGGGDEYSYSYYYGGMSASHGIGMYGGGNGGSTGSLNGQNATTYGSGGGGGSRTNSVYSTGGNGFSGVCIIRYYTNNYYYYSSNNNNNYGSTGGGYSDIYQAVKKNKIYNSYATSGTNGTTTSGGKGGSALSSGGFVEHLTGTNLVVGVGGNGAIGNSTPTPKTTYGSGGDGNGGLGTGGVIIMKFPIEKLNVFSGYQITNDNTYLKTVNNSFIYNNSLTYNNISQLDFTYNKGNVGIGITNPTSLFQVNSNIMLSGNITNKSKDLIIQTPNSTTIIVGDNSSSNVKISRNLTTFTNHNVSITGNLTVNGNITVTSTCNINIATGGLYKRGGTTLLSSSTNFSDTRIKTNINDINDSNASLLVSAIMPKTYNYIDTTERGFDTVIGFIAQQIKEVIPQATQVITEFIPNIYKSFIYDKDQIITDEDLTLQLSINDKIKFKDNDNYYKTAFITTITSSNLTINTPINGNNCFIYGKEVNDFHTIDKSYIYTTNIGATQDLYKTIKIQEQQLQELNTIVEQQELIFNEISQTLNI